MSYLYIAHCFQHNDIYVYAQPFPQLSRKCVARWTQIHCKHGCGAPLSSFPLLLVVVLAEHGGCLSSVDRDRELRIWNEREARRNECETRCWLTLERVRNSLLESFQSRRLSMVAGRDAKSQTGQIP